MRGIFLITYTIFIAKFTIGEDIHCEYEDTSDYGSEARKTFSCRLYINNPTGFDDFDRIPGNHDNEVNAIEKSTGLTTVIPSILCKQFENLEILSLAEKGIELLTRKALENCINLGAIYLSKNKIRNIHRDAFAATTALRFLDLDENQLSELPEDVFASLKSLEWLTISENPLHELPPGLFNSLSSLQYLYLSNCGIVDVKPEWFKSTKKLLYLEISENKIDELPTAIFEPLTELRHLLMSNNQLTVLDSNLFDISSIKNLKSLTFNGNSIEAIDREIFNAAENLRIARFYKNICVDEAVEVEAIVQGRSVRNHEKFSNFENCLINFEMSVKKRSKKDEL